MIRPPYLRTESVNRLFTVYGVTRVLFTDFTDSPLTCYPFVVKSEIDLFFNCLFILITSNSMYFFYIRYIVTVFYIENLTFFLNCMLLILTSTLVLRLVLYNNVQGH